MTKKKYEDRKCALYVSLPAASQTNDDEVRLKLQINELKEYCIRNGWTNISVYNEGVSGRTKSKPALDSMMSDIGVGRINTVLINKINRLKRSPQDFENIYKILNQQNVDLISIGDGFPIPIPKEMSDIIKLFSEFEKA